MSITLKDGRRILKTRVSLLPDEIRKAGKFACEEAVYNEIEARQQYTEADYLCTVAIMQTPEHDTGKIEGLQSYDSSASACGFFKKMKAAAEKDPMIVCGECYDEKQEQRWNNVKRRHGLQLRIISRRLIPEKYLALLDVHTDFFRFNSSGDIENAIHCANYYRIAKTHPESNFRLWSKNTEAVRLAKFFEPKPRNIKNIYSVCRINGTCTKLPEDFDMYFLVAKDPESVEQYLAQGLNECNGKHCRPCGFKCYKDESEGGWKQGSGIVEILRT